jgi:hypothetical protein
MCTALARHGVPHTIIRLIGSTLEGRQVIATLGGHSKDVIVTKGCPQGGLLSPIMWCLLVDEVLGGSLRGAVYAQGYADDICILAVGKFPSTVSGLFQWVLQTVKVSVGRLRLSVFPVRPDSSL